MSEIFPEINYYRKIGGRPPAFIKKAFAGQAGEGRNRLREASPPSPRFLYYCKSFNTTCGIWLA